MRARLLDMGEVSAVRSQSLFSAVAAGLDAGSEPIVALVRPAGPVISVGGSSSVRASVALDGCRAERVPVVRSLRPGEVWFQGRDHLLVQLVAPDSRAAELGLAANSGQWPEVAAGPLLAACEALEIEASAGADGRIEVAGNTLARFETVFLVGAVGVTWDLFVESAPGQLDAEARLLADADRAPAAARTAFATELEQPLGFGQIAEALIEALEATFDLDLVPSMPTPAELEGIYAWDQRVLVAELFDDLDRGAAVPTHEVM